MKSDPSLPVLFITRKHPPSVGGMQRFSYHLVTEMAGRVNTRVIAWGGSQVALPAFLLYALVAAMRICRQGVRLVHLGDALLSPIGWVLQRLFKTPVFVTVHGLDITYAAFPYQRVVPRLVRQFRHVVCVSQPTLRACVERGIPASICTVISHGVEIRSDLPAKSDARVRLSQLAGQNLETSTLLLTVGRLVPRKGVAAFIRNVLPTLSARMPSLHYLIAGAGPDRGAIEKAVREQNLEARVHMLGCVEEGDLAIVYRAADVFVAPNVPWPGDMEGFGLVVLEAAAMGLPVVASDLEGLRDAVVPGQNGVPLPHDRPDRWIDELAALLADGQLRAQVGEKARQYVAANHSWSVMADRYLSLFETILAEPAA